MTTGGAGLAAGLIAGTGSAPGPGRPLFPSGQGTGLVPPAPVRRTPRFCLRLTVKSCEARLLSLPAPPIGLARRCRGPCTPPPTADMSAGTEDFRGRVLRSRSRSGKQSARRAPSCDCSGSPRLDTALPTSGGGEDLWADGCPLAPLNSSLSLFFLGRDLGISMRPPQGGGQLGPLPSPCHTPVPVGIKKRTKPQNWGYLGLISWGCEGIKVLGSPGSLLRTTHWTVTPGLSPPLGPALRQQVSPGPGSWPLSTDLLSGQKEAATETLRQMEKDAGIWRGGDTREQRHRKTETRWG